MKKIFVITSRTGAGKSTLCKHLEDYFHYPLLSFAKMGKKFANANGYNRMRECHLGMPLDEFKTKVTQYFLEEINNCLKDNDVILIDGLYVYEVYKVLKDKYDLNIIHLKTDDTIRYERISKRLSITIEQVKEEDKIKDRLNTDVGINELIGEAQYVVDGNDTIEEVFNSTKKIIDS